MGFWGASYLYACFHTLTSLNVPIKLVLRTDGGLLVARAKGLTYDPDRGVGFLWGFTLRDEVGNLLSRADRVSATGIGIQQILDGTPIRVQGRGIFAKIERDKDGSLTALKYLPVPEEPTSPRAVSVQLTGVEIQFDDYRAGALWTRNLKAGQLSVYSFGDRWTVATPHVLISPNVGSVALSVRGDSKGWRLDSVLRDLEASGIVEQLAKTPDSESFTWVRRLATDSLVASGPLSLSFPKTGYWTMAGTLAANAKNLAYEKYHANQAKFDGTLTQDGISGYLAVAEGSSTASGTANLRWSPSFRAEAVLTANADGRTSLPRWVSTLLPKDFSFRGGSYDGAVAIVGERYSSQGTLRASRISYQSETATGVVAQISSSPESVVAQFSKAVWSATPLRGSVAYQVKSRTLAGGLDFESALAPLAKRFGLTGVLGNGKFHVSLAGTPQKPLVAFASEGKASAKPTSEVIPLGNYRVAGRFDGKVLKISRLTLDGERGRLVAKGTWTPQSDLVDFDLLADGLPLEAFSPELKGTAAFAGVVKGTSKNPIGVGRAEAFETVIFNQKIPVFQADLRSDRNALVAQNFQAVRGAGRLFGNLSVEFKGGGLKGNIEGQNLQISEILGDEYAGNLHLANTTLRGTLKEPIIAGELWGSNLVVHGVRVDSAKARGVIEGSAAKIDEVLVVNDGGTLAMSGGFDMRSKSGSFTGKLTNFPIDEFASKLDTDSSLTGLVGGEFSLQVANSKLRSAAATGDWDNVRANEVAVGSGTWATKFDGETWSGSTQIGEIDRFIDLADAEFNPQAREIKGQLATLNFRLEDLIGIGKRYVSDPKKERPAWMQNLESVRGQLTSSVAFGGTLDDPTITAESASLSALKLDGDPSGTIETSLTREKGVWTIRNLAWKGGPADFSASGRIEEKGQIQLDGEIANVNTKWLSNLDSRWSKFQGKADVSFSASGATQTPDIKASLSYRDGDPAKPVDQRQVDVILNVKEGAITADGSYFLDGFSGTLGGSVPFKYPFEILTDQDVTGFIELPNRDLKDLVATFPWIDVARTEGAISGRLALGGRWGDVKASGQIGVKAARVAMKDSQTELTSVTGGLELNGSTITLRANADGSAGGNVAIEDTSVTFDHLEDLFSKTTDELLQNAVKGKFSAKNFHIKHKNPKESEVDAVIDGEVDISGPLASPLLSSKEPIQVIGADILFPSEFRQQTGTQRILIDPRFDLRVVIADTARLRTGTGSFLLDGGASLTGTLSEPDLKADFEVDQGFITLPNARITLDSGGSIILIYKGTRFGDSSVRADVDLQGRTGITAPTFGRDGVERYTVFLDIKGNLLEQGGLKLSAQSDPPGLSQDAILNLLGQGEILGGRGTGQQNVSLQQQLQNALTQIALPAFLDSYTTQFAKRIGLDYFAFEYNAFERITVTAAKNLGGGFTLLFRRQLSDPLPGERVRYDLRVSYRPRFSRGQFRRVSFSAGLDQDRPWKFSIEYSFRF